jgi:cytochrome P450
MQAIRQYQRYSSSIAKYTAEMTDALQNCCVLLDSTAKRIRCARGIPSCLGASLARLEIRVAREELLSRTREFRHH